MRLDRVLALAIGTAALALGGQAQTSTTTVSVGGDPVDGYYAIASTSYDSGDCPFGYYGFSYYIDVSLGQYSGSTEIDEGSSAEADTPPYAFGPGSYVADGSFDGYESIDGSGNPCFVGGSSGSATLVVPQAAAQAGAAVPAQEIPEGQTLALTATVAPAALYLQYTPPTGTISLLYNSQIIGKQTIEPINSSYYGSDSTATFNLPTKGIAPGSYQIQLAYSGDVNYFPVTSAAQTVKIAPPESASSTSLTVSPNPAVTGDVMTLNATVTPSINIAVSGNVTFYDGAVSLGTATLNSSNVATLSLPAKGVAAGTYSITAHYSGGSGNLPSTSPAVSVTILAQSATATTFAASPTPLVVGQTLDLMADVTQQTGNTTPTGKIAITTDGATVATLTIYEGSGSELLSTAGMPAGTYSLQANYLGSATDKASSSAPVTIQLWQYGNVRLAASPNPVTQGNATTLTATVVDNNFNPVTSGTITFSISGNTVGSANLGSAGTAQLLLETGGLSTGGNVVTASYSGATSLDYPSGTVTLTVQ